LASCAGNARAEVFTLLMMGGMFALWVVLLTLVTWCNRGA